MILISNFDIFHLKDKEISSCIIKKDFKVHEIVKFDLKSIKCLVKTFNFTTENVRSDSNWALIKACKNCHLKVLKYLVETFNLTIEDIRSDNNLFLRWMCGHGHLKAVKYLVKTLNFTV